MEDGIMSYPQHSTKLSCPKVMFFLNQLQGFCHSDWNIQGLISLLVGQGGHGKISTAPGSASHGAGAHTNRWSHRAFLASVISQKLHSAKKRGVEENVTLGFVLHPPSQLLCWLGAESCTEGSATGLKCHQACGSTSLQPAPLRDHCGQ